MRDVSIPLSSGDPRAQLAEVIRVLESLIAEPDDSAALTLPLHIEADFDEALILQLVDELNGVIAEERRNVISLELGGMARTGSGYRLWGTIQLGASLKAPAVPVRIEAYVHDGSLHLTRMDHQQ
jgi:hypothetical protein